MNITLPTLTSIGQTVQVHIKLYADDVAHNPSTTVDTTTTPTISTLSGAGVATAALAAGDNRAVVFTATAAGTTTISVANPNAPAGGAVNYTLTCAPHVNNARIDHLTTDAPV